MDEVFVARRVPGDALERLSGLCRVTVWPDAEPPTPDQLAEATAPCSGLLTMLTDRVDDALLDAAPNLRVVANMAVGYDNVDVAACTRRGVPVSNTPGVLTDATADLAFALILAAARRLLEGNRFLYSGAWTTWDPNFLLGLELAGSTLGIVGMGRIGEAVARRGAAFGMTVLATSRSRRPLPDVTYVELGELLERSDVVSLHVALNAETRHLIGEAELARMKPTAILINTARGGVVDQAALTRSLLAGEIGAAGLDVFEAEPVPLDDPLLSAPNLVALPHVGSATVATRSAMASLAVDNLVAGLAGLPLPCCVNPEVYAGRA